MNGKTQKDFTDALFHELMGMIVDGACQARSGAQLSLWIRTMQSKLMDRLVKTYNEWFREPPPMPAPRKDGRHATV